MKKRHKLKDVIIIMVFFCFIWLGISNVTQAIKCPPMSQTELFLHLPKSFIANFKTCN